MPAQPGATATTTSTAAGCAIGGVANGSDGDPLVNKAVVTYVGIPYWHFNVGVIEPALHVRRHHLLGFADVPGTAGNRQYRRRQLRRRRLAPRHRNRLVQERHALGGRQSRLRPAPSPAEDRHAATHGNGGDENTQVLGRASDRLWTDGLSNIQVGFSAAKALYTGNSAGGGSQTLNFQDRPEIRVDGTRLVSTGGMPAKTGTMWAADLGGNIDNFFLGGEYAHFSADRQCGALTAVNNPRCITSTSVVDHPSFGGWYVEGSWIITGETKVYSPSAINNEVGGFNAPGPVAALSRSRAAAGAPGNWWRAIATPT